MYKVFINERPIILTDSFCKESDFVHLNYSDECIECINIDEIRNGLLNHNKLIISYEINYSIYSHYRFLIQNIFLNLLSARAPPIT